ncbi:hypothetical protein SteCoe_17904 [Stentor coeruleus]|uniref:Uncharacterized protein n=1 Tax=Stentor coeruleus TaxID=5963 RepID=A0A1R2BY91_9CILI|nr:hypothetical protein SteCoe_17904 [Stentor coeruleus]
MKKSQETLRVRKKEDKNQVRKTPEKFPVSPLKTDKSPERIIVSSFKAPNATRSSTSKEKSDKNIPVDFLTYENAILRSIFKFSHHRVDVIFRKWHSTASVKEYSDKKKKIERFIELLNGGLKKSTKKCLIIPPEPKSRDTILTNALLAICKNIIFIKGRLFNKWARCSTPIMARFQEYLLKNLAKILKISLQTYFAKWKNTQRTVDSAKMFGMIAVLQRIFANKGKRVFHPPYIVKDADEIMRRTIKKIRSIIHGLYDSAFIRWHYHKIACNIREKACVFYRACQLASNPIKNAFSFWREKLHSKVTVMRTSGTSKMVRALDKCFRARFKLLLFKTYLKIKPKKLLFRVFNFYSKKYCDETRSSFYLWKLSKESSDGKALQILKDSAVFDIIKNWKKSINYKLKQGFYGFMKNNKHRKLILIRAFITSWKIKKIQAWDRLKALSKDHTKKFKALKMATALKRATRRPQKYGLSKFIIVFPLRSAVSHLVYLFTLRMQRALFACSLFAKNLENVDIKTMTRGLRKDLKKERLRSGKATARSFAEVIKNIPRRVLGVSLKRITIDDEKKIKISIRAMINVFIIRPKEALATWFKFMHAVKNGLMLNQVRAEKLKNTLAHALARTERDAFQRITGSGDKVKGALKSFIRAIEKKTKISLEIWRKYVMSCKHGDLFDAIRSQKLIVNLTNIQKRIMRDSFQRVGGSGDKVKGAVKSFIRAMEKKTKFSLEKWKRFVIGCKHGDLFDAVRSQKLLILLKNIPKRTMKDGFQRIVGQGDKIRGALKSFVRAIEKKTKFSIEKWRKYVAKCRHGDLFDAVRSQKLLILLKNIPRRTMKDGLQRIVGSGDKVKGALKSFIRAIEKKTKFSIEKWQKFVMGCKHGDLFDAIRSQKLILHLGSIEKRTIKDSFQRIEGCGSKAIGALKSFVKALEKKTKFSVEKWKKYIISCKHGALLDAVRSQTLKNHLFGLQKRTTRDAFQRVSGAGDKIFAGIKSIIRRIEKRTQVALKTWKFYAEDCKYGKLLNMIKCEKLRLALMKVPSRTIKDAYQRIVGGGDKIKGAVRSVMKQIEKRQGFAYVKWKEYVNKCKHGDLIDGLKSQKLKNSLEHIIIRKVRDTVQRVLGAGDKIKGVIKDMIRRIEKRPQFAFVKWKTFYVEIKQGILLDAIKTEKLRKALFNVPARTMRNAFQLIIGSGNKVKGAINIIIKQIEKKPKIVLKKWNKMIIEIKQGILLDACRTEKLRNALNKVPRRVLRDAMMRAVGDGGKVNGVLKSLKYSVERRPRDALYKWKKYIQDCHKGKVMDALRAFKLSICMVKIPKRTLRDSYVRMQGNGNLLAGVFKNLENKIKNIPRIAFSKWKDWDQAVRNGLIMDRMRAQKLKNALQLIPSRTMKGAFQRIIGNGNRVAGALKDLSRVYRNLIRSSYQKWGKFIQDCKCKKIFEAFRTEKLRLSLFRLTLRTLKVSQNKIIGMGNAVNGALQRIFLACDKMTRVGYFRWKKFIQLCNKKAFLDNVKSAKLKLFMIGILKRTLKSTLTYMTRDEGNMKKSLSYIFYVFKQMSRNSFIKWRMYIILCKTSSILDNLRSYKLKIALTKIPIRTLRGTFDRILGDGDRVKGALKDMVSKLMNRPKFAIAHWKDYIIGCKNKNFMDNIRSEKVKYQMTKIIQRTVRVTVQKIIGHGDIVKGAFEKLALKVKNKPRKALQKWLKYREMINRNEILDSLKSQKLKICLANIPMRTLRSAFQRIIGDGDMVKGALRKMLIVAKNLTKNGFKIWRNFVIGCDKKDFMDNIRSQKLKNVLSRIPSRTTKYTYQRIIGDGSAVKGAMKTLANRMVQMTKVGLQKWRKYVEDCKSQKLLDGIRSHKLLMVLTKIPTRIIRDASQRISGDGNKIKGAMKNLIDALKTKPKGALIIWRKYIEGCKNRLFFDGLRSHKVKETMSKVARRTVRDTFLRIVGEGDKVRGCMKQIIRGIMKMPKVAIEKWRIYAKECKSNIFFSLMKSQKLKNALARVPYRVIRSGFERIVGSGNRATGALKRIFMALEKKAKLSFIDWRNMIHEHKKKNLTDNIRSQMLRHTLNQLPRSTLNEVFNRLVKEHNMANRTLRRLALVFIKGPEIALQNWKKFIEKDKIVDVKNNFEKKFKAMKVKNSLDKPARKVLRSAKSHADHDNTKLKLALKNLANAVTKRNSDVMRMWHVNSLTYVIDKKNSKEKAEIMTENRGLRLRVTLNHICKRTARIAFRQINPNKDRVAQALSKFEEIVSMRPKMALARWMKFAEKVKSNELLNSIKTLKLRGNLEAIVKRSLRNTFLIASGDGNRVKGALKSIVAGLHKKIKGNFGFWKAYVLNVKEKRLFDSMRSHKLIVIMANLVKRTLKDADERILGGGDKIKGAIRRLLAGLMKIPRDTMENWRKYVRMCKSKSIFDGMRSQKLRNSFDRIPRRILKDSYNRILGDGSFVKGAIRRLLAGLMKIPKNSIEKWKKYIQMCKAKTIFDGMRSQKLKNTFERMSRRTLKDASNRILGDGNLIKGILKSVVRRMIDLPKDSLAKWRLYIRACKTQGLLDNLRSQKLKHSLVSIPTRTLRNVCERIFGEGNLIKGALRRIQIAIQKKPKSAFEQWKKFIENIKRKKYYDNTRSVQLKMCMASLTKRTERITFLIVAGEGNRVKGAMRRLLSSLARIPKDTLDKWRKFVQNCKNKTLFDGMRSHKLKICFEKLTKRIIKDTCNRVLGDGDIVKATLRGIIKKILDLPKDALKKWGNYVNGCKHKDFFDALRSSRLKNTLGRIPVRRIKNILNRVVGGGSAVEGKLKTLFSGLEKLPQIAFKRWIGFVQNIKHKGMFDMMRSQKLKHSLFRLTARTLTDTFRAFDISDKIKICKQTLKFIIKKFEERTKEALSGWKQYVQAIHSKSMFDMIRTHKLLRTLTRIPIRRSKDAYVRLVGGGDKVKGRLNVLFNSIAKIPQIAFIRWKQYIVYTKTKGLLTNLKSMHLKQAMARLTTRTSKISFECIIGDGSRVAGALRRVFIQLQKQTGQGFDNWKKYIEALKDKRFLDNHKALMLKLAFSRFTKRTAKGMFERIIGDGSRVAGALRRVFIQLQKQSRISFEQWKKYIVALKDKKFLDSHKALALKLSFGRFTKRTTKGMFERIIGGGNRARGMLTTLANKYAQVPRDAIKSWKKYISDVKLNKVLDATKAQKLKFTITHMLMRTMKTVSTRITVGNPNVKTAFTRLIFLHKEGKKTALTSWRVYVEQCKKTILLDQVRTEKLRRHLKMIDRRVLKMSIERILGDGSRVKGSLRRLFMNMEKTRVISFQEWKTETFKSRHQVTVAKLRAKKFTEILTSMTNKKFRIITDKVTGKAKVGQTAMRCVYTWLKIKYIHAFRDWKEQTIKVCRKEEKIARKIYVLSFNMTNRTLKLAFKAIMGDSKIKGTLQRIYDNYMKMQLEALKTLWGRVEKIRTIKKINSAYYVFRQLLSYSKKVQAIRFKFWKNMDSVRRARIMKKSTGKMMNFMSINFEGAFWKWKYILTHTGTIINPKHSIVLNRLSKVGNNYQRRLGQFTFFKMILHIKSLPFGQKVTLPQVIAKILKTNGDDSLPPSPEKMFDSRPYSAVSTDIKALENPSNVSTLAAGSLSKEEVSSLNQMGAFEIFSITIKEIRLRKYAWGLASIFTYSQQVGFYDGEHSRLIEQITELRYEKHSLLEDNHTLRNHNDNLVSSLEKANDEFQTISLELDHLRMSAMIRILSRLAELSMHTGYVALALR